MALFKNHKRKTKEVEVQGEKFILIEPSAYNRIAFFEYHESLTTDLKEDASNFQKALINSKSDAYLIAICLTDHFSETSISQIQRDVIADLTDQDDINLIRDAAEELAGLKMEQTDLQDETSGTG